MSSETGWCTIESDPAVFSELIEKLGVKGLDVEELYDLDPASIAALGQVHGLIFLFRWTSSSAESKASLTYYTGDKQIFFAKQIVQNACATQAILSILMNLPEASVELGEMLGGFKEFVSQFDSELKGVAIGEHELIREVHNGFARPDALYLEPDSQKDKEGGEDPFHFVSILPVGEKVLLFDGLKDAPVLLGAAENQMEWLRIATAAIQERIAALQSGQTEIRFNLLAVVQDRSLQLQHQLSTLDAESEWQRAELEEALVQESQRRAKRQKENALRKCNLIPLIMGLLECMAKKRPDLISKCL